MKKSVVALVTALLCILSSFASEIALAEASQLTSTGSGPRPSDLEGVGLLGMISAVLVLVIISAFVEKYFVERKEINPKIIGAVETVWIWIFVGGLTIVEYFRHHRKI